MVMASRTWGYGGMTKPHSNTRSSTSRRVATLPASEQRAGGVAPPTDNQSVGRSMLCLSYGATSHAESQLCPFYRGNLAPKSAAASAAAKHPYAPPGVPMRIGGRHKKFSRHQKGANYG